MNQTTTLHFKGQKIWEAIIDDLLPQGLGKARKVYFNSVEFAFVHSRNSELNMSLSQQILLYDRWNL